MEDYPPRNMQQDIAVQVVVPKHLIIESYIDGVKQKVWLISKGIRYPLPVKPPSIESPFTIHAFSVAPNEQFIFGIRQVGSGMCDMFLWVRQKDKSYRLLPETVNEWIVRRQGKRHQGRPIVFMSLVRWIDDGNGVILAGLYDNGRRNLWHLQEIDLVRGRFAKDHAIAENKLTFLI